MRLKPKDISQIARNYNAPWLLIALKDSVKDIKRIQGPENEARILEYWRNTNYDPKTDEESYCAAAANTFLAESGYLGTDDPAARSFMELPKIDKFKPGCICVWKRGTSWQGHVNFGLVDLGSKILCIGANQSEWVKEYPLENSLGFYWPVKA